MWICFLGLWMCFLDYVDMFSGFVDVTGSRSGLLCLWILWI
ncbi:unnamed protein product [Linum tenue]|uniref:Uncharacterized protein n=1 Tax=Linum tenue TaxID=586396 RepID=A0AAV0IBH7_9ROSI|nr:unnamed protein product [Linum tenue]